MFDRTATFVGKASWARIFRISLLAAMFSGFAAGFVRNFVETA
jgi:hypothetical protein